MNWKSVSERERERAINSSSINNNIKKEQNNNWWRRTSRSTANSSSSERSKEFIHYIDWCASFTVRNDMRGNFYLYNQLFVRLYRILSHIEVVLCIQEKSPNTLSHKSHRFDLICIRSPILCVVSVIQPLTNTIYGHIQNDFFYFILISDLW